MQKDKSCEENIFKVRQTSLSLVLMLMELQQLR